MIKFILVFLGLTLFMQPYPGFAEQAGSMEARAAFQYLNQIRKNAGMIPFLWHSALEESSLKHAVYLSKNRTISHVESSEKPYFTGVYPGDRALSQGYNARDVSENHSSGDTGSLASIDGLMGAIYHRFGFLDFTKDEIGIGLTEAEKGFNIVYNMGNNQINRYCGKAIDISEGPFYENFCKGIDLVPVKQVNELEITTMEKNPPIVVWPPEAGHEIPVVFYEEIPDPLPNSSVSGYPISIQFNPALYSKVQLLSFELFKQQEDDFTIVKPVHLIQKRNDSNRKFSEFEFALFPLKRLEWNTAYQARVKYLHDGLRLEYSWEFKTKQLKHPIFVIAAKGESLKMVNNKTYYVYVPPRGRYPYIEQLGVESPYSVQVNVAWEDRNTIALSLSGEKCQRVQFQLNGKRSFSVNLAQADNLNIDHDYSKGVVDACN